MPRGDDRVGDALDPHPRSAARRRGQGRATARGRRCGPTGRTCRSPARPCAVRPRHDHPRWHTRRRWMRSPCGRGSPASATGGPASTGRPARRWSTGRSRRWPHGRRAATTPTPAARSPPPTPPTPCSSGPGRVAELLGASAGGIVFGANMTTLTLAFTRAVAATLAARRSGRRHPPRPRRQRHAVAPGLRPGRRRARPRPVRPGDRPARPGRGDRADRRAHPLGRRHRRLQPARHDPRPRADRRRRPRRRRPRLRRRRAPRPAPPIDVARDRLRRARDQPVQVVRPARRRALRRSGAARRAAGGQGPPGRRPRPPPLGDRARRASRRSPRSTPRPASCSTSASTTSPAARRPCSRPCSTGCTRSTASRSGVRRRWTTGRPTVAFTVAGHHPDAVATALAARASPRGPATPTPSRRRPARLRHGGIVRAGVTAYVDDDDVSACCASTCLSRPSDCSPHLRARRAVERATLLDGGVDALEHVGVERRR